MTEEHPIFESTDDMPDACKPALRNLLLACADTKLLLGYHYGEWTFGPPEIEAAVACCSLCQSELGHVRLLHGILHSHYGDDPDELVERREAAEFANIAFLNHEMSNWAEFVAANYLVDLAVTTMLHAMKDSAFKPLHMSLAKMLDEERYHVHHGQGWFRTLAQKSDQTKAAIEQSAQKALAHVLEWFGPEEEAEDRALVAAGIKSAPNEEVVQNYLNGFGSLCKSLSLSTPLRQSSDGRWRLERDIQWNGWNPRTRRLQASGPDDEILYHLKGSKNKVFKLN